MTGLLARLRRVRSFLSAGPVMAWPSLAALGWARDNPSSVLASALVKVRPSALRGTPVSVDATDLGQLVSFEEVFVQRTYDLALVPFTPQLIIDCGAHVGFFSALAAARYPGVPVEAFEPNPANLDILRSNLSGLPGTLHAAAVATQAGSARFSASVSNGGRLQATGTTDVRVDDLRSHLPGTRVPLLLKMDIEGEEIRVLPHVVDALPRRCALFIETHDGEMARRELSELLAGVGFSVTVLRERERYADVFALRNDA